VSGKKEAKAKAAPVVTAAPVKKADPQAKIKRDETGKKIMKTARGTERARRRAGLKKGWKQLANLPQMLPTKAEEALKQAA
jgi:hypothetical protein